MPLYPLGVARSRDVPRVAEAAAVAPVAVRWVLAGELAGAVIDAPQARPEPLHHAALVDAIHRRICVLPMRFGTALCDEAEVRTLLERRHRDLLERLRRLEGTCEMGLRIALAERQAAQAGPSADTRPSIAYLQKRRVHYQRQDLLSGEAGLTVRRLVRELDGTYCDWRRLIPSPPGLVRLAFLVERSLVRRFRDRVGVCAAGCPSEQWTLLGPWPPYSFV